MTIPIKNIVIVYKFKNHFETTHVSEFQKFKVFYNRINFNVILNSYNYKFGKNIIL